MRKDLKSFKIQKGNKILDYRIGKNLNLTKVRAFFQKDYHVKKIWQGARHILGILEKRSVEYFLKLSTSEGISIATQNEYEWDNYFNKYYTGYDFVVPKTFSSGWYEKKYYFLITDHIKGEPLNNLTGFIPKIIKLSEIIQKLPGKKGKYKEKFLNKVRV